MFLAHIVTVESLRKFYDFLFYVEQDIIKVIVLVIRKIKRYFCYEKVVHSWQSDLWSNVRQVLAAVFSTPSPLSSSKWKIFLLSACSFSLCRKRKSKTSCSPNILKTEKVFRFSRDSHTHTHRGKMGNCFLIGFIWIGHAICQLPGDILWACRTGSN